MLFMFSGYTEKEHWLDMFKVYNTDNGTSSKTSFFRAYLKGIQNINVLFPDDVMHVLASYKINLIIRGLAAPGVLLLVNINIILSYFNRSIEELLFLQRDFRKTVLIPNRQIMKITLLLVW